jgi:hypothetical protein
MIIGRITGLSVLSRLLSSGYSVLSSLEAASTRFRESRRVFKQQVHGHTREGSSTPREAGTGRVFLASLLLRCKVDGVGILSALVFNTRSVCARAREMVDDGEEHGCQNGTDDEGQATVVWWWCLQGNQGDPMMG